MVNLAVVLSAKVGLAVVLLGTVDSVVVRPAKID